MTRKAVAIRCLVIFLLSLCWDFLASVHIKGIADRQILAAVLTIVTMQYLTLISQVWFVDAKGWARFWFASATAAGAGLGTWLVLR